MSAQAYPLEGITVLDLGQVYQGPYCGYLMALAGARVIKIESPTGDSVRSRADAPGGSSLAFAMLNGNKEGMTLDLKTEAGRTVLKELARHADVLIENYAPGVLEKLGVGSAVLREINPRLIYASGSGYGSEGPYRDCLAMDLTIQAVGGIMSVTGLEETPPLKAGAAVTDFLGGSHLFGAIMMALYRRSVTGEGAALETAMLDMCYHTLASNVSMTHKQGRLIPRTGNRHGGLSVVPYNVYPTRDGHIAIICVKDGHWKKLAEAMGRPELASDPAYATNGARAQRIDEVDELVAAWTRQWDKAALFELSMQKRFPAAPVRDLYELSEDPHLHARGSLQHVEHPTLGDIVLPHSPLRLKGVPRMPLRPDPALGEHNAAVLADLLEWDEERIAQAQESGAFGR